MPEKGELLLENSTRMVYQRLSLLHPPNSHRQSMFLAILFCFFSFTLHSGNGQTIERAQESNDPFGKITASGTFNKVPNQSGIRLFLANVTISDSVLPSSKVECEIDLTNNTTEVIEFDNVRSGCACSVINASGKSISPGESGKILVRFQTPGTRKDTEFELKFFLDENVGDKMPVAVVRVKGTITGNLFIDKSSTSLEIRRGNNLWNIPVSISDPISLKTLKLKSSKSLLDHDVKAKLSVVNNEPTIQVSVTIDKEFSRFSGWIEVEDTVIKTRDKIEVEFFRFESVKISPSILTFVESDGEENKELVAKALLRVRPEKQVTKSSVDAVNGKLKFLRARIGETDLEVKTFKLANGVYRVKIKTDAETLGVSKSSKVEVVAGSDCGEQKFSLKTGFPVDCTERKKCMGCSGPGTCTAAAVATEFGGETDNYRLKHGTFACRGPVTPPPPLTPGEIEEIEDIINGN